VLEDARVNLDRAPFYLERLAEISREVAARLPGGTMEQDLAYYMNRGQERKAALSLVLLGLMMPLVAIIMVFISAVSTMLARMQAQEVAMLMSRGMRRIQVLGLTLVEVSLLLVAALPLGLGLSLILARLLGYSASFMRFVPRVPLTVSLASLDGRYLLGAVGVTLISRLALSWGASRRSIVAQERENARSSPMLGATRLLLMGVLVAATYYSYFRLIQVGSLSVVGFQPGEEGYDPLLLLSPSLFLLVGPMLLSELFVWLLRPLAWISPLARGVASYLGLMDLGREGGQYRMSVYMLALCLGFGVYCASLARSADTWILDRRRFEMGADIVLRPESLAEMARRYNMPIDQARVELDTAALLPISDYEAVPGVAAASQVGEYEASVRLGGLLEPVQMLAVDRYRFANTGYWRADYAHAALGGGTESLGALMNRLGVAPNGLLMQADLAERYGLALGDTLEVSLVLDPESTAPLRASMTFELAGLLDYFPTALEPTRRPVVVADLNYMQLQSAGSLPFAIWLRLEPGVDAATFLRALPLGLRLAPEYMFNLQELVEKDASRMERVGIFGALSISFLAGALLSALGLLVHTAAAQRRRALRFAVLQVLGMDRPTLAGTMLLEYGVTLGYSVLTGIGLGIAASELYVPLVHLSGSRGVPIPPYVPIIDRPMAAVLGGVMALTLLAIEVGLIRALMRSRVFETLRMGTRE
jgi:putative ABC transport system permease protein